MAIWWGLTGTATASRTETAELTGTATVSATPTVYIDGTATVDRTSLTAWAAQARRTATRVLLGDEAEDLIRISGDVSIALDEDALIATASFVVKDPRCAFFATGSLVTGDIPVSIRVRIATDTADADTLVFRGKTEAAPTTGTYCPVATIQCAGEGSEWLTEKGCLYLPAFSEKTRLEVLQAFAESVGIDPARIRGGETWKKIRLAFDLSGLSPHALAKRFARLEDHYIRLDGEDLELLPARQVVGPEATAVFDFTPSNFFSCSETPPNRPVSRLVLSAVGIPEEVLAGGTTETTASIAIDIAPDGSRTETLKTSTTINGVLVQERIEVWRDAAIPGVTPSAVSWRLMELTETTTTWGAVTIDGVSLRTSRVDSERTTTRKWYSPPCRTADGYVWSDGTRHLDSSAAWQVTDDRLTTYVYDTDTCLLSSKTTNVGGWYSELVDTGETYDDGAIRADAAYQWIAQDAAQPYQRLTEANAEEDGDTLKAVSVSTRQYGWQVPPGSTATPPVEEWRAMLGRDDRWSTVPGSGVVMHAWTEYFEDGSSKSKTEPPVAGALPVLVHAAADIPQFRTKPLVLTAIADGAVTGGESRVETAWGAETIDPDLVNAALQTFREERSPRFTIRHPAMPLLRKYDVVTVTDPTWQLVAKKGYVAGFRPTFNVSSTGKAVQETVVVFPLTQYDPGATLAEVS